MLSPSYYHSFLTALDEWFNTVWILNWFMSAVSLKKKFEKIKEYLEGLLVSTGQQFNDLDGNMHILMLTLTT